VSDSALRWKGRLSRLRLLALLLGIVGVVLLIAGVVTFANARENDPARPLRVQVGHLVRGEVSTGRYVTVSGLTDYDIFYTQTTESGSTVARYYFLMDEEGRNIVLVEADGYPIVQDDFVPATVTGVVRSTASGLKTLINSDLGDIHNAELETNVELYVEEGATPPTMEFAGALLIGGVVLLALAIVPFTVPGAIFGPAPLEATVAPTGGDPGAKATGVFQNLKSVNPLQVGRGTRKFDSAVANLVPLNDRRLLVYIHHILTTRAYGIKVSQRETHWGVFIGQDTVVDIEPGKLYGWKPQPAVRLRYRDDKGKERDLVVSFNHAAAQAGFISMLKQMGFVVGSGMPAAL
jgi:hypothetical protein